MKKDFAGTYPIIFNGSNAGKITVSREGLFWHFDASCKMCDEIIRLSVFGDGIEGYLGVMAPHGDNLALSKKLSDASVENFPNIITHAGKKGENSTVLVDNDTSSPPDNVSNENDTLYLPLSDKKSNDNSNSPPQPVENPEVIESLSTENNDNKEILPPNNTDITQFEEIYPQSKESSENVELSPPPKESIPPPDDYGFQNVTWNLCPCPSSLFSNLSAKSAFGDIRGAFTAETENGTLLAVPAEYSIPFLNNYGDIFEEIVLNLKNYKIIQLNNLFY